MDCCNSYLERLIVFNQSSITSVIAAFKLTLSVNGPLTRSHLQLRKDESLIFNNGGIYYHDTELIQFDEINFYICLNFMLYFRLHS